MYSTFDMSLLIIDESLLFKVKSETHLGGEDCDNLLANYICNELIQLSNPINFGRQRKLLRMFLSS